MPATDKDVKDAREEVDELRDELAEVVNDQRRAEVADTNDIRVSQLEKQAESLRAQIAAVREGGVAAPQVEDARHEEHEGDAASVLPPDDFFDGSDAEDDKE